MLTHTLTAKVQEAMENIENGVCVWGGGKSQETVFDLEF